MKRMLIWTSLAVAAAIAAPAVLADGKTKDKTLVQFEGLLGGMYKLFGGSAAKDGISSTVAIKGNRMASLTDTTGEIIDLTEQKVYRLDLKKKEYRVVTFEQMRAEFEKARAEAEKNKEQMKPEDKQEAEDASKQLEFDFDVKETGQKKSIAGVETRQVIMTITGHEKGKKVEDSGGLVLTVDSWLGPKSPVMDEIVAFRMRYAKAIYGETFLADAGQMAAMIAAYPSFSKMSDRMRAESGKLQGTAYSTVTTFEGVKSPEQMKQAQAQQQQQPTSSGGLGGMLAKKMMGANKPPQARTKVMTALHDTLSIETTAAAEDVAIPAGFKEKK
jgi:hypothetical protein